MPFTPFVWIDEILAGLERYKITKSDGTVLADDVEIALKTPVLQAGTPLVADRMNTLEQAIADIEAGINAKIEDQVVDGVTTKAPSQNAVFDAIKQAGLSYIGDQITDGVIDKAPSQNAVFDALAKKVNFADYFTSEQWIVKPGTAGCVWLTSFSAGASIPFNSHSRVDLATGATNGNVCAVYSDNMLAVFSDVIFFVQGNSTPLANSTVLLGLWPGGTVLSTIYTTGLTTTAHYGFKIVNGAIFATSCDGTHAENSTDTGITISEWIAKELRVRHLGSTLEFYVDGVLKATHSTNVPTVLANCMMYLGIKTTAAADKRFLLRRINFR